VKERPILFSSPMVRAILEGRKTQTRRKVKLPIKDPLTGCEIAGCEINSLLRQGEEICKHGVPRDRLWVKETFTLAEWYGDHYEPAGKPDRRQSLKVLYRATEDESLDDIKEMTWKPSIFMPRWASRITLEIEVVRVERLIEITSADAIAEGVSNRNGQYGVEFGDGVSLGWMQPEGAYRELWESINGPGSWDANPWVWVIQFRRVT